MNGAVETIYNSFLLRINIKINEETKDCLNVSYPSYIALSDKAIPNLIAVYNTFEQTVYNLSEIFLITNKLYFLLSVTA